MKPVSEMSNAELIDEARRRAERRQSGMPLAPTPVELQKRERKSTRDWKRKSSATS
jgi:hypothetical protein